MLNYLTKIQDDDIKILYKSLNETKETHFECLTNFKSLRN